MGEFKIQIAGLTAQVHTLFESTREYCRRYLTEEEPSLSITVTREDLAFEQEKSEEEALEEGLRIRKFTEPFLERATIQRKMAEALLDLDTLLLHGSTVAVDGAAYLFTAKCRTGKSTHTRLWREVFGQRAVMVNDDKPFLKLTEAEVLAYGSPWSGKHGLDTNMAVPLKGICILHRGEENRIHAITPEEALPMLLHQSYRPLEPGQLPKFLALVEALSQKVPLWSMTCTKDAQAALVSYRAMSTMPNQPVTDE